MTKGNDSRNRVTKWIRWTARIWGLPIIVFALPMPLGYAFAWVTTGVPFPESVGEFPPIGDLLPIFMFLSALGLGIAWLSLALIHPSTSAVPYLLSMIITIPGVLFLVCWWRSRKRAIPITSA